MAMENKRITQLSTERLTLTSGDYVMVDDADNGSAKYRLDRLKETDNTLSVSGKAADAAATGQAISDEAEARDNADNALGEDIGDLKSAITYAGICDIGSDGSLIYRASGEALDIDINGYTIVATGSYSASVYVNLDGTPSKLLNKSNSPKNFDLEKGHEYQFEVKKISGSYGNNEDYVYFGITDGVNWIGRLNAAGGKFTFSPQSNISVSVLFYVRYGTTLTDLKNELIIKDTTRVATYTDLINADVYSKSIVDGTLINGLYADATGAYNNDRSDYVCTQGLTSIMPGSILKIHLKSALDLTAHVVFYASDKSRVSNTNTLIKAGEQVLFNVPSTAYYFAVSLSYQYGYTLNPDDYEITVTLLGEYSTDEKISVYENNYDLRVIGPWNNNIYTFGTGVWFDSPNRIGLQKIITPKSDVIITCDDGYSVTVGEFTSTAPSVTNEKCYTVWVKSYLLEANKNYLVNMRKDDNSNISPDDGIYNNHVYFHTDSITTAQNFMITGFKKTPTYVKRIGVLPDGLQSFCKYNDKYYSTDGSHIYVSDADFNLEDTVDIEVGHGNSFQLGSDGIAYISGWDDQKVYCIDMETLTLDSVIDLPTTGYTTVAIDDINNLAYIFQRDTNPNTEDIYNFIVYNYQTEQIVSTKKLPQPFAAMQSCIFVDGKIFVINGLYTSTAPNGYRVYNTVGDVIAEYILESIDTEPEGVFYDKTTNDLYISDSTRRMFIIT